MSSHLTENTAHIYYKNQSLNDLQRVIAVTYDNHAKHINKTLGYLKDFKVIQHVMHTAAEF